MKENNKQEQYEKTTIWVDKGIRSMLGVVAGIYGKSVSETARILAKKELRALAEEMGMADRDALIAKALGKKPDSK